MARCGARFEYAPLRPFLRRFLRFALMMSSQPVLTSSTWFRRALTTLTFGALLLPTILVSSADADAVEAATSSPTCGCATCPPLSGGGGGGLRRRRCGRRRRDRPRRQPARPGDTPPLSLVLDKTIDGKLPTYALGTAPGPCSRRTSSRASKRSGSTCRTCPGVASRAFRRRSSGFPPVGQPRARRDRRRATQGPRRRSAVEDRPDLRPDPRQRRQGSGDRPRPVQRSSVRRVRRRDRLVGGRPRRRKNTSTDKETRVTEYGDGSSSRTFPGTPGCEELCTSSSRTEYYDPE